MTRTRVRLLCGAACALALSLLAMDRAIAAGRDVENSADRGRGLAHATGSIASWPSMSPDGASADRGRGLPLAAGSSGGRPSALPRLAPSPPRRGGGESPGPRPLVAAAESGNNILLAADDGAEFGVRISNTEYARTSWRDAVIRGEALADAHVSGSRAARFDDTLMATGHCSVPSTLRPRASATTNSGLTRSTLSATARAGLGRGCSKAASARSAASGDWSTLLPGQSRRTNDIGLSAQPLNVDVLITGGRLVDGTGAAPRTSDVGLRGDRIVFVGDAKARGVTGTRTIDARGLVVAPGFIDPHAHVLVDLQQPSTSRLDGYLMQGVTTVLTGNDGGGPVNVGAALSLWTRNGIGPNAGVFIGQGSVRGTVVGRAAVAATPTQIDSMRTLVRRAMQQGAMGLSSGLFYAPGSFATTEEVIELAKEVAPFGGVYDTHQRDESSYGVGLLASTREAMRIAKEAGITLNISHIKALGVDVWGRSDSLIAMIRAARGRGDRVFADQYPYTASGTSLTASLVPRWAEDGGNAALLARFANDTLLPRLRREMEDNMRRRGGAASLLLVDPRDKSLLGLTLAQVAERMKTDAISAAIAVIKNGGSGVASFNMQQSDIDMLAKEPWVMTGSDGSDGHPRKYGTFPKKLREYVYDRPVLSIEAMVHQSSALPAQVFGLVDRGEVREGKFADVIVFDPATVRDKSTYIEPTLLAVGMRYVFVNGVAAVDDGQPNKITPGRALKGAKAAR